MTPALTPEAVAVLVRDWRHAAQRCWSPRCAPNIDRVCEVGDRLSAALSALSAENQRLAGPGVSEGDRGRMWSAIRSAFPDFAERYVKATRYEEASAIADAAARDFLAKLNPASSGEGA